MIKGYFVTEGYMGYVDGRYQLFADETDYIEYMEEQNLEASFLQRHFCIISYSLYITRCGFYSMHTPDS